MRLPTWKALTVAGLLTMPFLGVAGVASAAEGDQHAVDYGNGYAQNVETETGWLVGPTYAISPGNPAGEVASSTTYRPPVAAIFGVVGVEAMIVDAARRYGLDATRMLRVARCESGFNPNAIGDGGASHGVFQFQRALWSSTPQSGLNRLDARANVEAAAWVMSRTGYGPWSCK